MIATLDCLDDRDLLRMAYRIAMRYSDDQDTRNGAVVVSTEAAVHLAVGANRLPDGVEFKPERISREGGKYQFMEHAERDAIFNALQMGVDTVGATLYVPWYACDNCARAIIGAGITEVVGHKQMFDKTPDRWKASIEAGNQMMDDAGVRRRLFDGEIGDCESLFDGAIWYP